MQDSHQPLPHLMQPEEACLLRVAVPRDGASGDLAQQLVQSGLASLVHATVVEAWEMRNARLYEYDEQLLMIQTTAPQVPMVLSCIRDAYPDYQTLITITNLQQVPLRPSPHAAIAEQ